MAGGGRMVRMTGGGGGSAAGMSAKEVRASLGLGANEATYAEMQGILKPYFWPSTWLNRLLAFSCFFLLAASKACNIAAPLFFGYATDALLQGRMPLAEVCLFGGLRFAVSLLEEGQRLVYLRVKEVAYREIAVRTFAHLLSLSHAYHTSRKLGVVLRASDRGISSASTIVDMLFLRLGPTVLEMLVTCIVFASVYGSPGAAGVLLLSFVAYFAATISMTGIRTAIRAKQNVADNDAAQLAMDCLGAIETVKAWSAEGRELARYSAAVGEQQMLNRSSQGALVSLNLTQQFIMRGAVVGVLLVAALDVLAGRSTVGDFAAIQVYVVQLFMPLMWLGTLYTMIASAGSDMKNLADLLKEPATVVDAPSAPALRLGAGAAGLPRIEFRGVCFSHGAVEDRLQQQNEAVRRQEAAAGAGAGAGGGGVVGSATRALSWAMGRQGKAYGNLDESSAVGAAAPAAAAAAAGAPAGATAGAAGAADAVALPIAEGATSSSSKEPSSPRVVLNKISFSVPAGTTTAIVGTTGSGKSTISRLLMRLCDPTEGQVLIDGQRLDSVTQASVRGAVVGYVPQDIALFNDTLAANISFSKPSATPAEVAAAVQAAQLSTFLSRLPDGLATRVGERGLKLSGGERQRVAIARALLADPPILVLDEATSSLDSLTEASVHESISARPGRTTVIVAHRLSTVRHAREILVLEAGSSGCGAEIVERGSHEELLALGEAGRYSRLWHQQLSDGGSDAPAAADAAAAEAAAAAAAI